MTALELFPIDPCEGWNPFYVAYAASEGLTAAELSGRGGWNAGFLSWMTQRWAEWEAHAGITNRAERSRRYDEFGVWLAGEYPAVTE